MGCIFSRIHLISVQELQCSLAERLASCSSSELMNRGGASDAVGLISSSQLTAVRTLINHSPLLSFMSNWVQMNREPSDAALRSSTETRPAEIDEERTEDVFRALARHLVCLVSAFEGGHVRPITQSAQWSEAHLAVDSFSMDHLLFHPLCQR